MKKQRKRKIIAHHVENHQAKLYAEIISSLNKFSENTGVVVAQLRWESCTAHDSKGRIIAIKYYALRGDLCTGMS